MSFDSNAKKHARSTIKALIFDPIAKNRKTLRQILISLGFRDVDEAKDMAQFQAALEFTLYDLVFAECCQDAGGEKGNHADALAKTIKAMRFGDVGPNPYLVSINTAWLLTDHLVKTILSSGTDDLLVHPFSNSDIERRITSQIKARKTFIVTSDYVGPDRRKNKRSPSTAFTLTVPNSLQAKALGDQKTLAQISTAIEAAKATITVEKMRRQPLTIGILANLLSDASWDKKLKLAGKDKLAHNLGELLTVTEDLSARIGKTGFSHFEHIGATIHELVRSMMEKFQSGEILNTDDLENLKKHSTSLQIAFNPEETEASVAANITSLLCRRDVEYVS